MKSVRVIVFALLIVSVGYLLWFAIGMSSTYPSVKKYSFEANKTSFEKQLANKIDTSEGWALERRDSIKGEDEACYGASLFYTGNGQEFEYDIKYCFDNPLNGPRARLEVVGAFDHVMKSGGYKLVDRDVEKLMKILDSAIINELSADLQNESLVRL